MVEAINGIDDESVLKRLHKRAITIGSVGEFQLFMEQIMSEV